jgi:tRNA G18 (ribose-2'-O)-methylase SpoU
MTLDPEDPMLDGFRRLNEPRFRRRYEEASGTFIAEGPTVVSHVGAHAPSLLEVILVDRRMRDRVPTGVDVPVHAVDQSFIAEVVGFEFHRGMLALCRRPPMSTLEHVASLQSVAVLEGVNDHENLGAIIRAAAGLGIDGLVLDPSTADPWYRRSVRVSMGTVVDLPMVRAQRWPADLDVLADAGMTLVAATPAVSADDIRTVDAVARPAVMLGAEGAGLTSAALGFAALRVRIPMQRGVDSLNVGQAAAVLFDRLLGSR